MEKIIVNIFGEVYEFSDFTFLQKSRIVSNEKIGDTYFLKTNDGISFSIHQNFWHKYLSHIRNKKIKEILS